MLAWGCRANFILMILLASSSSYSAQNCSELFDSIAVTATTNDLGDGFRSLVESLSPEMRQIVFRIRSLPRNSPQYSSIITREFERLGVTPKRIEQSFSEQQRLLGPLVLWKGNIFLDAYYRRTIRNEIRSISNKRIIVEDAQPWIEIDATGRHWTYHKSGAASLLRSQLPTTLRVYRGASITEDKLLRALKEFLDSGNSDRLVIAAEKAAADWDSSELKRLSTFLKSMATTKPTERDRIAGNFLTTLGGDVNGVFTSPDRKVAERWAHRNGGSVIEFDVDLSAHSRPKDLYVGFEGGQLELAFHSSESRYKLLQAIRK